jgi:ribosomal protein S14
MTAPYCETCQDEPAFARCPDCGSMPLGLLHDLCREPLRQIAQDMCAKAVERDLRFTMELQRKDAA